MTIYLDLTCYDQLDNEFEFTLRMNSIEDAKAWLSLNASPYMDEKGGILYYEMRLGNDVKTNTIIHLYVARIRSIEDVIALI